jgi:UDP-N-acetylglucosamine--N-acetylmuramyl-(pentapeptide) pyrophosphoryl-undecaprenol N-acetylglucosamine transferase
MQTTNEYEVTLLKVLIAGGGTGGHINPGLAIAKFIRQKHTDSDILFIGTRRGLETSLVPREGFELKLIKVRGFKRKLSKDTFIAVKELIQGYFEARRIIKQFKPDIVIGTGGYVCGPVVFNAAIMRIPTVIHEQNAFPGVTNRILSRFVDAVALSFKESEKYFDKARRVIYTGNPVRNEVLAADRKSARAKYLDSASKQLVVVVGGSLGAERINDTIARMLQKYAGSIKFNMIFATGNSQFEKISSRLNAVIQPSINVVPYIYDAGEVYAAADIIVCRAGAITCSELTALGVPSIMIPSPNVTANHQEHNARSLERSGASVVILEKDLNEDLLFQQVSDLLKDKEQLLRMSKNARKIGIANATEKIYEIVMGLVKDGR